MNPPLSRPLPRTLLALLVAASLAGCAALGGGKDGHVHPAGAAAAPAGPGAHGMGMHKDMQAMCDMHRQKMAGKTPQERQAAMQEQMRSMAPEMRQRMQGMMNDCQ